MNIKLNIKDLSGKVLQTAYFSDQTSVDNFTSMLATSGAWGSAGTYSIEQLDNTIEVSNKSIKNQIDSLETQVTPRRIREAILSGDHTFIQSIDAQIATLRGQLK